MKLTLKEKLRLAHLKSISADKITDTEKSEMVALETKANNANENVDEIVKAYAPDPEETANDGALTPEELSDIVVKAVKDATSESGIDSNKLVEEITGAIKAQKTVTVDEIEAVITKHLGGNGIDKEALVKTIRDTISAQRTEGSITEKQFEKLLDKFAASVKAPRANQFPESGKGSRPVEHRSGNLSVAEKQLLNICLMNVSADAKASTIKSGGSIPTGINDGITAEQLSNAQTRGSARLKSLRDSVVLGGKTLTTGGSGEGAELVFTDLSSLLQERMYLNSDLAMEMMASEIQMPTDPFKFPMTTTRPVFKVGAENPGSNPGASNPGTANITLDAKKLIGMSDYSYEADEDSIVAVLPMLTDGLSAGAAEAFESALIEGDTTATHQHSDYHAVTNHHAKLFKGFRKYALAGSIKKDLSTGNINASNIKAMRKLMQKYGVRPRDLILIAGPQAYNDLVGLDETLTFEKVGSAAAARILTGEAASIFGIRIVVSAQLREDLNASGVYDGSTTTKGSLLLVHRPSWMVGVRRGFTLEVDVDKMQQVNYVIASFRRAFTPMETPSTSLPLVCLGYNNTAA
jgi:HK97 family phage major capsid protein